MQWGEPATIFDSTSLDATVEKLSDHLFNRGYFENSISYRTKEFKKRVGVVYHIEPGRPSFYDTIFYQIADKKIESIVQNTRSASLIKINDRYDQDKLNKERERLDLQMKNLGILIFPVNTLRFLLTLLMEEVIR
ncbi:MAG: hypothetical protein IPJ20_22495 [Flammeovirgaceae bacterium]|nr:hypothetical protein [Flammeovirgaceae bacterium]